MLKIPGTFKFELICTALVHIISNLLNLKMRNLNAFIKLR
jgi:hypothetical protein